MEDSLPYKIEVQNEYNIALRERYNLERSLEEAKEFDKLKEIELLKTLILRNEAKIELLEKIIHKCHG